MIIINKHIERDKRVCNRKSPCCSHSQKFSRVQCICSESESCIIQANPCISWIGKKQKKTKGGEWQFKWNAEKRSFRKRKLGERNYSLLFFFFYLLPLSFSFYLSFFLPFSSFLFSLFFFFLLSFFFSSFFFSSFPYFFLFIFFSLSFFFFFASFSTLFFSSFSSLSLLSFLF